MPEHTQSSAWLEQPGWRPRRTSRAPVSIGRVPSNHVVLADEKVSRRHAVIHAQDQNEFLAAVDLGSSNGTLPQIAGEWPSRSNSAIKTRSKSGRSALVFRRPAVPSGRDRQTDRRPKTLHENQADRNTGCSWQTSKSSTELQAAGFRRRSCRCWTGRWFDSCKQIIDSTGGSIDKYLGDGFLACWHSGDKTAPQIAPRALTGLKTIQAIGPTGLPGRGASRPGVHRRGNGVGRRTPLGPEINFVFRMERLASVLGAPCVLSEPAQRQIKSHLATGDLGQHETIGIRWPLRLFQFLGWVFSRVFELEPEKAARAARRMPVGLAGHDFRHRNQRPGRRRFGNLFAVDGLDLQLTGANSMVSRSEWRRKIHHH